VDSFFDITYRIDFVGKPGGMLDGMAGETTASSEFHLGVPFASSDCLVYDNGTGTADFPPDCPWGYGGHFQVSEGLPPESTLEFDARWTDFALINVEPGGDLGGMHETFDSVLYLEITGTGELQGFARSIVLPVEFGETYTAPRGDANPMQHFTTDLWMMSATLEGDPDFFYLNLLGGSTWGPSPGETTFSMVEDGLYAVDSFFDIQLLVIFKGSPGSILDGMDGIAEITETFTIGLPDPPSGCALPDNGTGTVNFPPECEVGYLGRMRISEGLPPGSSIEIDSRLHDFDVLECVSGGDLGGEAAYFVGMLQMEMSGRGDLTGFSRTLEMPVECITNTAPRTPGEPVQVFDCKFNFMGGEFYGDPDFDHFEVRAGDDLGLPCPGETTFTEQLDGSYFVDSFFDITYEIEFVGAPGSILDGMSGITTGDGPFTIGIETASPEMPLPSTVVLEQCYPNPFNPSTKIFFSLPEAGSVKLAVYSVMGRLVKVLAEGDFTAGRHFAVWSGTNEAGSAVASGAYFYRLETGGVDETRSMLLLK